MTGLILLPPGSPPRMRGKGRGPRLAFCHVGITPAYAGKRIAMVAMFLIVGDHPRVCGEKGACRPRRSGTMGSPPRMRGKDRSQPDGQLCAGITPAYAGKRRNLLKRRYARKDHPRVCGEKGWTVENAVIVIGSPPRMRGKGAPISRPATTIRITPAYAGKSHSALL